MADEPQDAAEVAPEGRDTTPRGRGRRALVAALQAFLAVAILAAGIVLARHLLATGPTAGRNEPKRHAVLVAVREVARSRERAVVHAMGTVRAAQAVSLQPRISGQIVELAPECIPGGRLKAGDLVARIDPADYKLAVEQQETEIERLGALLAQRLAEHAQRESDVAVAASLIRQRVSEVLKAANEVSKAEAALRIEQGQQAVALREYKLLGRDIPEGDRELVLRGPQLATAQATLEAARAAKSAAEAAVQAAEAAKGAAEAIARSAQAAVEAAEASKKAAQTALKQAKLNFDRTEVRAPFSAIVEAKMADLGSQVTPQTPLVSLLGTDEFWVEVSVPVDQLQWIRIPRTLGEEGSAVRVYNEAAWGQGAFRAATILRLASSLETEGRMARLLVAVPDPLGMRDATSRPPALLIGSYVRVEIDGTELDNVVPLERELVHEGDQVWVMGADGALEIRRPAIIFRGRDHLLVSQGLETGEKVVTTNLAAPVPGLPLRTDGALPAGGNGDAPPSPRKGKGKGK